MAIKPFMSDIKLIDAKTDKEGTTAWKSSVKMCEKRCGR